MFNLKIQPRRIITVGGTLLCALGIGYLMQSNAHERAPQESGVSAPPVAVEPLVQNENAPLNLTGITLTSAIAVPDAPPSGAILFPDAPVVLASLDEDQPIAELPGEVTAPAFACEVNLTADPSAAAMVTLTLDAPCLVKERFTVHHNGMMFTEVTDKNGKRSLSVPALAQEAVYIVSFSNGEGALAKATVTALEYYDRVVVQWTGDSGLQIHALEFDAGYDDAGHVWAGGMRDISIAARGEGGFITRHGASVLENPNMVEVYTFPSGTSERQGDVRLSLEAEITGANCGRDVEAHSLQMVSGGQLKVRDIMLSVPDCSAVGDFLVLKNVLNDLKIARN